jgi:aerobic carbon-monoxide dehydrogenase small subunit
MLIRFTLNGQPRQAETAPAELVSELLRERLGLTGTHVGCDTSQCGACVVHLDGVSVKSCTLLAASVDGRTLTTIEGLARGAALHPMQQAFTDCHGLQCGFCTPGMIMSAVDYAQQTDRPSPEGARRWLEGNLCRCTGYVNIVAAVMTGCRAMKAAEERAA